MRKLTVISATFATGVAMTLGLIAAVGAPAPAPWEVRLYHRLDARYHGLPQKFVDDLLAHPPTRVSQEPHIRCGHTTDDKGDQFGYCICFGVDTCSLAPNISAGREHWECLGPLGAIDDKGTTVCHARPAETVTITG